MYLPSTHKVIVIQNHLSCLKNRLKIRNFSKQPLRQQEYWGKWVIKQWVRGKKGMSIKNHSKPWKEGNPNQFKQKRRKSTNLINHSDWYLPSAKQVSNLARYQSAVKAEIGYLPVSTFTADWYLSSANQVRNLARYQSTVKDETG